MAIAPVDRAGLLGSLPPEWPHDLLPEIQARVRAGGRKVVVLDDDPTGTQTVHSVPVLTGWSVDALVAELRSDLPACYLLTNSRSLPLPAARALNAEIGRALAAASRQTGRSIAVISRGDSTLRGHYPGEVDALVEALDARVDATLIIPFFLEGGRYTVNDVHYVAEGERLLPAGETPFARDVVFGYRASNLREWVEEKTAGRVRAVDVEAITLDDIRIGGPERVAERLLSLTGGRVGVVNAASYRDLEVVVAGLLRAEAAGRIFAYRTAASFVRVRAGIAPRDLLAGAELAAEGTGHGLFLVGSHVLASTVQLERLLQEPGIAGLELSVPHLLDGDARAAEIADAVWVASVALEHGQDVVIYTSRQLMTGENAARNLAISRQVSSGLAAVMRSIDIRPRYIVAKGGITASDVATLGLAVRRAMVMGQILPGVPVWRLGEETRYCGLPYVVFPGNVGEPDALVRVLCLMCGREI